MRQYNGARVLSSDVSSGRPAAVDLLRTGADGPRAARTGKRDDRNTSKLPLRLTRFRTGTLH